MSFYAKLDAAIDRNQSLLCVGLDPDPTQIPDRYRVGGGPAEEILAWNRGIIEETADLVCAYKPNIAFYEALGVVGMEALRGTLALIPDDIPVLLDVKRGDIGSTAAAYARACFEDLAVDAVTLSPYLGRDSVDAFAAYPGKGLFVLCHTSNPSAGDFQTLEISDWRELDREGNQPLYAHVARTATRWSEDVGLVIGATYPEALEEVRGIAPKTWFLVPGIGAQGGDLAATLAAGLREDGAGLIISASRSVSQAANHGEAVLALRDAINVERQQVVKGRAAQPLPADADSDTTEKTAGSSEHDALIFALADLGAIQFGEFTLASGRQSPFYIDLRLLVSRPSVLAMAAEAYTSLLSTIAHDRIAGVPYAALPIGTAVALAADSPLIYPRKETKAYGMGKQIEGAWQPNDRIVVIEDLITSGGSIVKSVEAMRAEGLIIEHAIVLIDREQGGVENLAAAAIQAHSVFKLSYVLDVLVAGQKLTAAKRQQVLDFIAQG